MDYMKIATKLQLEDLDPRYQEVADIIGVENYIKLCEYAGGSSIFFPLIRNVVKRHIYSKIHQFGGSMSKQQIARAYGVSRSTVYRIFKEMEG